MRLLLTSVAFAGLAIFGAAATDGPLEVTMEPYVVSVNEDGTELKEKSKTVEPGQLIEYELVYSNVGDSDLSVSSVSAPIPASTDFVLGSEITAIPASFEVTDGTVWGTPPLMRETDEGMVEVPVSEYTSVRWVPADSIEVGENWEFNFRVAVE